jgi:uncharacterized protein (TIGR02246 family)
MRHIVTALAALSLVAANLAADDKIDIFGHAWTVPSLADWKVAEDAASPMLQLLVGREPLPGPRRPVQFALLEMPSASRVTLDADVRPTNRSLIVVYAYRDAAHFNYVHFSTDSGAKAAVHNGVFHVYGGERVRISATEGPAAFSAINRWFHIRVQWDGSTGEVQGFVDGQPVPALHAADLSLNTGRVGIGSFDETGDFKNVVVKTGDDDALRQLIQRYVDARNHLNIATLRQIFTSDADQLVSTGTWRRGLEALLQGAIASSKKENGQSIVTVEYIRMLGPDTAIVDGRYEASTAGAAEPRKMWSAFVLQRTSDGWKIAAIRNMLPVR